MNFLKAFSSFLLVSVILLIAACKKDASMPGDALAYVPSTATSVTAFDLKKMMQKADFEAIKQMDFYKEMVAKTSDNDPQIAKVLIDPAASGVDLDGKIYSATAFDEQNPEEMTTYFFIPLKDAKAFGSLMKSSKGEISEKEGIKIMDDGGNTIMGWNESLAVFAFSNEGSEDFEQRLVSAFKIDPENTLAKEKGLQKALNSDHDVTSWLSTNPLAKNSGAGFALSMIDVKPEALKDNFISSYADFENGKMVGHADFEVNDELGKDFIGRFFKKEASADFSKVLPNEPMTFATVMALDLVGIDKFLSERPNSKKYADFALNDFGIKRSDLINALGGDVMVAGFGAKNMQDAKILVSMSLKNEAKARELLQFAVKEKKLKEVEKDVFKIVSLGNADFNITVNKGMGKILLKNGMLTFCSDEALFDKIKAGETGGEGTVALKSFDNQTFAGWFDFAALQNAVGGVDTNVFKEMNFKVNGKGTDFILETKDPKTNSLKAMFEMINAAYLQSGKYPEEAL
ncbi:MAG: DUF4836 family protein [Saprospiraceae bacterium]|nr:DUF4836 family protein [Saprospiraceae bacterium]MCF8248323.1 DUF4836 family protein [Saprospiraceae bacterium]MCF8280238.1 DUF4836 family protein [Bacteroidales bacterium]MCF8309851.1 DUF4836 family protein [Saprospiraceae bacterium]MCF8438818.1 DUF4836 family protein [Saprospiraceae bacterium]